jgi:hypothetical protein
VPPLAAGVWFGGRAAIVEYHYRWEVHHDQVTCGPNLLKPGVVPPPGYEKKPSRSETYRRLGFT